MEINRRKILIDEMASLEAGGKSCMGCKGTCCTYEANSMMITPFEGEEIFNHLKKMGKLTAALKDKLIMTVNDFKLQMKFFERRPSYLRKTYTCPFFHHQELGCSIPKEVKPYGCLAFNSHHETKKADENCFSDLILLEKREEEFKELEKMENEKLRSFYEWEKSPIPNALLAIWERHEKSLPLIQD